MRRGLVGVSLAFFAVSCGGTTGGELVSFSAFAAGPADAVAGQPYVVESGRGYHVTLTRARLHVGAVYLDRVFPPSGETGTPCTLSGDYVAEVVSEVEIDVLSGAMQSLGQGSGTLDHAVAAEVWLTGKRADALDDQTIVLDVAGTAERAGASFPFDGRIALGRATRDAPQDPAFPGASPACRARIASPIGTDLRMTRAGRLVMRIDPAGWFSNVDFAALGQIASDPPAYRFDDASTRQPDINLRSGLISPTGIFAFTWESP